MTTTALPSVPTSILAVPSASLPTSSSAISIPLSYVPVSAPVSASASSLLNEHGLPPPPPPPSTSSALLSKKIAPALKPDKLGEPVKRASWEYVDLEEDDEELVSVSISEECSSVGAVSGDSGLGVGSGASVGLGHLFSLAQQPQSTRQLQPITKLPSMNQQQRRQLELQYQQSGVQTRLHVEPDSDGSEDGGGTTTASGDASFSVSELITTVPAASISISRTAIMNDSQPSSLNSIPHSIPRPIPPSIPNSSSNPNPDPNLKLDARTNNHPKHTHTHTRSHYSHLGFHSDSNVAHIEDTSESELDLDVDLDRDRDVGVYTVQQVGGASGDVLLPSLGYLDEALSFIAEERARWSAAREGSAVGAGGSGSAGGDAGFAKGGGKKKVLGRFPFFLFAICFLGFALWCWCQFLVVISFFGLSFVNVHE